MTDVGFHTADIKTLAFGTRRTKALANSRELYGILDSTSVLHLVEKVSFTHSYLCARSMCLKIVGVCH